MPSNHLILCCPLLLPSVFPRIRVFSSKSLLHIRWPKYWSFSFSISPSSEYSGLISFRMDCLDLLAVQGTLKSLLQRHCCETDSNGYSLQPPPSPKVTQLASPSQCPAVKHRLELYRGDDTAQKTTQGPTTLLAHKASLGAECALKAQWPGHLKG